MRVLRWIIDRCKGTAKARDSAIGQLPAPQDLDTQALELAPGALDELLAVEPALWQAEFKGIEAYLEGFGARVPPALVAELADSMARVTAPR